MPNSISSAGSKRELHKPFLFSDSINIYLEYPDIF